MNYITCIHNWLMYSTKVTVNLDTFITCQQSEFIETWLFHRSNCTYQFQKGYDELQYIVPTCQQTDQIGGTKLSKATVLQRCKRSLSLNPLSVSPLVTYILRQDINDDHNFCIFILVYFKNTFHSLILSRFPYRKWYNRVSSCEQIPWK